MKDVQIVDELWRFHCLGCLHRWERPFRARHGGAGQVAWERGGQASMPPWIDPSCPGCRGTRVKVLPAGG
ncbi:hypothetical protein [Actinomadura parmotrematis]|nr:hypothetical protein [Actinomadura parmotrematis]